MIKIINKSEKFLLKKFLKIISSCNSFSKSDSTCMPIAFNSGEQILLGIHVYCLAKGYTRTVKPV